MAVATSILIGMAVAGVVSSAYGKYKEGKAAKAAGIAGQSVADSQAGLADYNAQVAELQAKDAITRGAEAESAFRSSVRGMIGNQRAGFAGANIDVSSGSAVDVQADAAYLGELDALTIRTNAAREAWGYQVQAEDLHTRATIARKEGVMILAEGAARQTAANIGMVTGIIGGATSIASQQYGFGGNSTRPSVRPSSPAGGSTRNYSSPPLSPRSSSVNT